MRYTAIADVSKRIVELLREGIVPMLLPKEDLIGLCSPDNTADYMLGIHLYHVEQSESFRMSGKQNIGLYNQKYPPVVLDLHYMITPYYKSDVKFLAEEEQIVLGRIIQIINDNSSIAYDNGELVELSIENVSLDDIQKIWGGNSCYRASIFLAAKAVVVDSAREKTVARVKEFIIDTDQRN